MTQGAFPGPAVAVSPTGTNLAMGPAGPPGKQGAVGPAGPTGPSGSGSGTTPVAPTIWTATTGPSGGPTYAFPANVNTHQNFDTTAGAIAATFDPTPLNGELHGVKDVGFALGTNALTLDIGGANVEWPPGQIATSNIVLGGGDLGAGPLWQWFAAKVTWFLV